MAPSANTLGPIAALMFATGLGIPIQAALNGSLGRTIANPFAASVVLFAVGLTASLLLLYATGGPPPLARFAAVPWPNFFAGLFMVFYIVSITWAAPRIGVGNAVFFVLLGQLVAAAIIDHFGLWGAMPTAITPRRLAGIAAMALGVYLARKQA